MGSVKRFLEIDMYTDRGITTLLKQMGRVGKEMVGTVEEDFSQLKAKHRELDNFFLLKIANKSLYNFIFFHTLQ